MDLFGGEILTVGQTELLFDASLTRPAAKPGAGSASTRAPPAPKTLEVLEFALVGGASAAGAVLTAAIWFLAR